MEPYKYVNPFTDYGFKLIFGSEANKDLLIDFLNAMFTFHAPVVEVQFENTEQLPASERARKAIYDIYCTDAKGNRFIVEMQKGKITYFKDRALSYLTYPITAMQKKNDWDFRLDEIYYLVLLDFRYEPRKKAKLERLVRLMDQDGEVFYSKLQMKYIQLPVFNKKLVDLQSRYDQWLYFLKHLESMEAIPELFMTDSKFKKALTLAEIAKMEPEEAVKYNLDRIAYMEIKGVSDAAYSDGRQDAEDFYLPLLKQEQEEKELAKLSAEQAEKKAEQERKEKITLIASFQRMIDAGVPKELIAQANEMSVEALERLLKDYMMH